MSLLVRFLRNASGTTAIEYALVAVIVSVVILAALQTMGPQLTGILGKVSAKLASANN